MPSSAFLARPRDRRLPSPRSVRRLGSAARHRAADARPVAGAPADPDRERSCAPASRGPAPGRVLALHGFGDAGDSPSTGRRLLVGARHRGLRAGPARLRRQRQPQRWPGIDALIADATAAAREVRRRIPACRHRRRPLDGRRRRARRRRRRLGRRRAGPGRPRHRRRRRAEPACTRCRLDPGRRPSRRPLDRRGIVDIRPTDNLAALPRSSPNPVISATPRPRALRPRPR